MQIVGRKKKAKTAANSNLCFYGIAIDTNSTQIQSELSLRNNSVIIKLNVYFQIESIEWYIPYLFAIIQMFSLVKCK